MSEKQKLRMKDVRAQIFKHGGFSGTATLQIVFIGVKQEDIEKIGSDVIVQEMFNAAKKHLTETFDVEMVKK